MLERSRALHEDLEVLEKVMSRELGDAANTGLKRPDEIARDQVVATLLKEHSTRSGQLGALYDDADGARAEEIAATSGSSVMFSSFYDQLKLIREYHRKFPGSPVSQTVEEALLEEVLEGTGNHGFTGEEAEGRYVDVHALHEMYLNLKGVERIDYTTYLSKCADVSSIARTTATTGAYSRYVRAMEDYFLSFLRRTQPLVPLDKLLEAAAADFEARWAKGDVARWQQTQHEGQGAASGGEGAPSAGACDTSTAAAAAAPIDLTRYAAASELEELGLEMLKIQLTKAGLKAGGSLSQRAERLFLLKSAPIDLIPKKELAKPPPAGKAASAAGGGSDHACGGCCGGSGASGANGASGGAGGARAIAMLEDRVARLGELLFDTLDATKDFVEKKQARTYDEIERDLVAQAEDEEMVDVDDDEEEAEKPIYNPLNLPLGWDGKPIPYWLYKLHGLNLEFKCEICGNYSYWGPKPFERHFQEWRHSYGMKCLGIPNTKPFQVRAKGRAPPIPSAPRGATRSAAACCKSLPASDPGTSLHVLTVCAPCPLSAFRATGHHTDRGCLHALGKAEERGGLDELQPGL